MAWNFAPSCSLPPSPKLSCWEETDFLVAACGVRKSECVMGAGTLVPARNYGNNGTAIASSCFLFIFRPRRKHMLAKTIMAALAGTALLATVASAQTPTATDRTNAASSDTVSSSQLQGDWRASKVVGLSVYNNNNEKLGSINDFLMDKSGSIKAVVLGGGGFPGR